MLSHDLSGLETFLSDRLRSGSGLMPEELRRLRDVVRAAAEDARAIEAAAELLTRLPKNVVPIRRES